MGKRISELAAATGLTAADLIEIVQSSTNKKAELSFFLFGSNKRGTIDNGTADLNNILKSGFYAYAASTTNAPDTSNGILIHGQFATVDTAGFQIAVNQSLAAWFVRRKTGGSWTSWVKLWTQENDGTGSGLDADLLDGIQADRFVYGDNAYASISYAVDLNSIVKSGFYRVDTAATNKPGSLSGHLIHIQSTAAANYATQIWCDQASPATFVRSNVAGSWSAWSKLWNDSNDGAASGLQTDTVPTATPASAGAAGTAGMIRQDASYIYICTATNTWKRVAIATW